MCEIFLEFVDALGRDMFESGGKGWDFSNVSFGESSGSIFLNFILIIFMEEIFFDFYTRMKEYYRN